MDIASIIGNIAGIITVSSALPQLYKIILTSEVIGISIFSYIILFIAQIFWLFFGYLKQDLQIFWTNAIGILITTAILYGCLYFRRNNTSLDLIEDI